MRFHRPKRRQSASTSTWPPCAVAWSELVRRRCRVDFYLVNNGMDTHHHKGDVAASTISPAIAFLFTRLRIGEGMAIRDWKRLLRPPVAVTAQAWHGAVRAVCAGLPRWWGPYPDRNVRCGR